MLALWKESYDKPRQHIKKQRHHFADNGSYSQSYGFPVMYLYKSATIKKAERWRMDAFELWCWRRLLRVSWAARSNQVNTKGNQPWIFIERTDAEAEASVRWPSDAKSQLTGKDPDAGKDEGQWRGRQRMKWIDSVTNSVDMNLSKLQEESEIQQSLACRSPWGCKQLDLT